jgi:hypothetical protein
MRTSTLKGRRPPSATGSRTVGACMPDEESFPIESPNPPAWTARRGEPHEDGRAAPGRVVGRILHAEQRVEAVRIRELVGRSCGRGSHKKAGGGAAGGGKRVRPFPPEAERGYKERTNGAAEPEAGGATEGILALGYDALRAHDAVHRPPEIGIPTFVAPPNPPQGVPGTPGWDWPDRPGWGNRHGLADQEDRISEGKGNRLRRPGLDGKM